MILLGYFTSEKIPSDNCQPGLAYKIREIKKDEAKLPRKGQLLIMENEFMKKLSYLLAWLDKHSDFMEAERGQSQKGKRENVVEPNDLL